MLVGDMREVIRIFNKSGLSYKGDKYLIKIWPKYELCLYCCSCKQAHVLSNNELHCYVSGDPLYQQDWEILQDYEWYYFRHYQLISWKII